MRTIIPIGYALMFWVVGAAMTCGAAERAVAVKVVAHRPGLKFTRFTDSRENAFSVEVPQGWKTAGGLFRFASVDTRGTLETVSPDGEIRVSWGDATLPPFTVPNPMLAMAGFREGSWYAPGYGVKMLVKRYTPGASFAEESSLAA
ncbi:MAG: hypothetical protein FJW20_22730 [Acidimicrobiia bacterium]|nr:hypothetical protein [Acidimicrobiia bacterium]